MKLIDKKTVRRGVIALAFAGTAIAGGQGVADAGTGDYPPVPEIDNVPSPTPQPTAASPDSPDESPKTGATLPQTGGPGTTSILLAAGAAVAAGVAVTGVAARRRADSLEVA